MISLTILIVDNVYKFGSLKLNLRIYNSKIVRMLMMKGFKLCGRLAFAYILLFSILSFNDIRIEKDYFEVTTQLTPIIYDSIFNNVSFSLAAKYCGPQFENLTIPSTSTFVNPLKISNIKITKNTDVNYPSDLYWIHFIDNNTIQVHCGLYCLPRIIFRGDKPPPDTRPRPFMNISFSCMVREWKQIYVKTFSQHFKSATKTLYQTTYPYIPQNTSHKITKWQYSSSIKIFRDGQLYREYEVSDKNPNISKVHSYLSQTDPTVYVEIIE